MTRAGAPIVAGSKFGRFTILRQAIGPRKGRWVLCHCECGTEKLVRASEVLSGRIGACSPVCAVYKGAPLAHRHPLYRIWVGMRSRCRDPYRKEFPNYGGRGIQVCERWEKFWNFVADMGPRPSEKHSIDRIDNDGNYEPGNCRWATMTEQLRNRRGSRLITWNGATLHLDEWAERLGMPRHVLYGRVVRRKWPVERALTTPLKGAS